MRKYSVFLLETCHWVKYQPSRCSIIPKSNKLLIVSVNGLKIEYSHHKLSQFVDNFSPFFFISENFFQDTTRIKSTNSKKIFTQIR